MFSVSLLILRSLFSSLLFLEQGPHSYVQVGGGGLAKFGHEWTNEGKNNNQRDLKKLEKRDRKHKDIKTFYPNRFGHFLSAKRIWIPTLAISSRTPDMACFFARELNFYLLFVRNS
jgi:hypothetical protein